MLQANKPPTERDVLERLMSGAIELPPLRFEVVPDRARPARERAVDLVLLASWQGQPVRFAAQWKAQSTPKAFENAVRQIQGSPLPAGTLPLIVVPYLRDSQLRELERRGISGLDLCGNGVVIAPAQFAVYRSGAPNMFPSYAPIKNIYRKNTSMVARALLAVPDFDSVQAVRDAVNDRNLLVSHWGQTPMGLSTVSKSLKGLEEDLIIDRSTGIQLLQAEKLLDNLQRNYEPPRITRRVRMNIEAGESGLAQLVRQQADAAKIPVIATGLSSVSQYAVMQREDVLAVYCPRSSALQQRLPGKATDRFPNLELLETEDQPLYFNARVADGFWWASPEQAYLELMAGDKRDRETAEQIRERLLVRTGDGNNEQGSAVTDAL